MKLNHASLLLIFLSSIVQAETLQTVINPMWQAPALTAAALPLDASDPTKTTALNTACATLETNTATFSALPIATQRRILEENRQTPLEPESGLPLSAAFSFEFVLALPSSNSILSTSTHADIQSAALAQAADEARINYTQLPEDERINPMSLRMSGIEQSDDSLTANAKKLGLDPLPVRFIVRQSKVYVEVSGADLACDLINHRASISALADAALILNNDSLLHLKEYYMNLSTIIKDVESTFPSARQRAAVLGYRLGQFYSEHSKFNQDHSEGAMLNTLDTYLDPTTLGPNPLWTTNGELQVTGISPAFQIQLSISKSGYSSAR